MLNNGANIPPRLVAVMAPWLSPSVFDLCRVPLSKRASTRSTTHTFLKLEDTILNRIRMQRLTHEGGWLQFRPPTATLQWKQRKRERKMQLKKEERESKSTMPARIGDGLFFIQWAAWQTGLAPVAGWKARNSRVDSVVASTAAKKQQPRQSPQNSPRAAQSSSTPKCDWKVPLGTVLLAPKAASNSMSSSNHNSTATMGSSSEMRFAGSFEPSPTPKRPSRRTLQPINSVPQ